MLQAALRDGSANRQVTCEVFGRRLPNERRYGVVAGTERVLRAVELVPAGRVVSYGDLAALVGTGPRGMGAVPVGGCGWCGPGPLRETASPARRLVRLR